MHKSIFLVAAIASRELIKAEEAARKLNMPHASGLLEVPERSRPDIRSRHVGGIP